MSPHRDLENRSLLFVQALVAVSGLSLAVGLLMQVAGVDPEAAKASFTAGLLLLMATPVLRVLIAVAERVRRRDFQLVLMTLVVLLELSLTMWYAATRV